MSALALAYVAIGGAFGSLCRYLVSWMYLRHTSIDFPVATLTVNVLGAFLMGLWLASVAVMMPGKARDLHLLFAVGALGGFTTFSAFAMDIFFLFERGLVMQAALYIALSVICSVLALVAGIFLVRLFA